MSTPSSGSPTVGLGRFIKESRFIVPSHQRDYSWTREYVQEFIRDIEDAVAADRETYFCGLMVFTSQAPGLFKVLDGQQRLATTLMIYSAVRNWLRRFIYRLGNMCLLPGINHALGNKSFVERAEIYKQSRLQTTSELARHSEWGRKEIIERQRRMAKLAVAAWHFQ